MLNGLSAVNRLLTSYSRTLKYTQSPFVRRICNSLHLYWMGNLTRQKLIGEWNNANAITTAHSAFRSFSHHHNEWKQRVSLFLSLMFWVTYLFSCSKIHFESVVERQVLLNDSDAVLVKKIRLSFDSIRSGKQCFSIKLRRFKARPTDFVSIWINSTSNNQIYQIEYCFGGKDTVPTIFPVIIYNRLFCRRSSHRSTSHTCKKSIQLGCKLKDYSGAM